MKKTMIICLAILTMACNKKDSANKDYTVSFYAYSKNVPFAVKYHDADMNWSTDSVYSHTFSKSLTSNKKSQMYVLHGMNGKKIVNDSIYVRINLDSQESHDSFKFSNVSADITVQLTSPN